MARLENKVIVITGASRGLGEASARLFAGHGAKLVLTDIDESLLNEVADAIPGAIAVRHDVTDEQGWQQVIQRTLDEFGQLDVLVNNAGIYQLATLAETTLEQYNNMVSINQTSCFLGMKAAAAVMQRGASIINLSSVNGMRGAAGSTAYSATKFAVRGMTKAVALELAPQGIRVNSVHPGAMKTRMLRDGLDPVELVPVQRFAEPEEVGKLLLFLACDDSSYCTGSEFIADGGLLAG